MNQSSFLPDFAWWVTVVDIPALTGLLWMILRARGEMDIRTDALRENLSTYKLEVARTGATIEHLKEVEARLVSRLRRIEAKLDAFQSPAVGFQAEE